MVAKIRNITNIRLAVRYNERKVRAGLGECIYAGNFLKDVKQLSLSEKQQRFLRQIELHRKFKYNSQHISLNFAPGELISREMLIGIAKEYMRDIGFGEQPYLVYEHLDSGHPHIHIVTTCIRYDGSPIAIHNLWLLKSLPAIIAIEQKYGLVKVKDRNKLFNQGPRPNPPEKLRYGKIPTELAITRVLDYVLNSYSFRDLDELNAVLRLYNIRADAGKEGSSLRSHQGLVYKILDAQGKDRGTPIKASTISFRPTLKWLNSRFALHRQIDPVLSRRLVSTIEKALTEQNNDWRLFTTLLRRQQIAVIPGRKADAAIPALIFVDLGAKVARKADELGENYTSKAIFARIGMDAAAAQSEVLDILFRQEQDIRTVPYEFSQKSGQKKSKIHR